MFSLPYSSFASSSVMPQVPIGGCVNTFKGSGDWERGRVGALCRQVHRGSPVYTHARPCILRCVFFGHVVVVLYTFNPKFLSLSFCVMPSTQLLKLDRCGTGIRICCRCVPGTVLRRTRTNRTTNRTTHPVETSRPLVGWTVPLKG